MTHDEYHRFLIGLFPRAIRRLTDRFGPISDLSPEVLADALAEALPATIARIRKIEQSFRASRPDDDGPSSA